jgi:cytochrome c oxidase subunit 2
MSDGLPLFPPGASTMAGRVDALFWFMLAVSALICLGVFGAMLVFILKYRRRPGNEVAQRPGATTAIELTWTLIPLGLAMVPFVWGARLYLDLSRPPADALEIYVVAKQWMWQAQHPAGQSEIDELHVPVGYPVKLTMISQDVIHSFSVPDFRIKTDVLPGRYTTTWFEATRPGEYPLYCNQYCGTAHSRMIGRVVALRPAEYGAWLAGGPTTSPAEQGHRLFDFLGCPACHETGIAPSLQGLFGQPVTLTTGQIVTADEGYIRESILAPAAQVVAGYQPIMPPFAGRVNDEQILQLIAYIRSLGSQPGAQGLIAPPPAGPALTPLPTPVPSPAASGGQAP